MRIVTTRVVATTCTRHVSRRLPFPSYNCVVPRTSVASRGSLLPTRTAVGKHGTSDVRSRIIRDMTAWWSYRATMWLT